MAPRPGPPTTHLRILVSQVEQLHELADRLGQLQGRGAKASDAVAALLGHAELTGATDEQLLAGMNAYYTPKETDGNGG